MILKRFYTEIAIRIVLIALTGVFLGYVLYYVKDPVITANVVVAIVLQGVWLYARFQKIKQKLERFFDAINYDDSGLLFPEKSSEKDFASIINNLFQLNTTINRSKMNLAKQSHYLMAITDNTGAGLLSFEKDGKIKLLNRSAKDLLRTGKIQNIETLNSMYTGLADTFKKLKPSEQRLVTLKSIQNNTTFRLLAKASDFVNEGVKERIISLKDVGFELDSKELDAWQKMIRVLNHEVMNTIGPMTSSMDTMKEILKDLKSEFTEDSAKKEMVDDLISGLEIISERTEGLQAFVKGFRSLTRLPELARKEVNLHDFMDSIHTLFKAELDNKNIDFKISKNLESDSYFIDPALIQQVIINLIKNAMEALFNISQPRLELECTLYQGRLEIAVADNGKGIPSEIMDEIFVPFFTTKPEGSGIGLSLSRQIMRMHGGNILVSSVEGEGSRIKLVF